MKKNLLSVIAFTMFLCGLQSNGRASVSAMNDAQSFETQGEVMPIQERARVRAPELTGGRGWLNTDQPLTLAALRGKVVLLDFWTYGCINCIHIIPDLKRLEAKYPNNLVVIGVHSAKFENEKESENIRRIILRYGIEHPVINDADFQIWQAYAVRAWPTRILIDPAGYIVGKIEGEGSYEALNRAIATTIDEFRKRGELKEEPLKLTLERAKTGDLPLAFPGKVLCDAKSNHLFIADSNHNRIVVTKLDGTLVETIGTGAAGKADGDFTNAQFNRPQGMAFDEATQNLYVADTENHLLRRVDLKTRKVETIGGTGEQLRKFLSVEDGMTEAKTTAISSPWDLQLIGQNLYIAMAGVHQIWRMDLAKMNIGVFAGSGAEARLDGKSSEAAFAQSSGLTTDGKNLYVADSESNIIRRIDLSTGEVMTLAGGDLFEFGDKDGQGDEARLQHPLGVLFYDGAVFIADTYNHKIKRLNPEQRTVQTFVGMGKPGQMDGSAPSFYEPGGLSFANGKLYIADTNNQAVRVIDLQSKETRTLMIKGLTPPNSANAKNNSGANDGVTAPNSEEIKVEPQRLRARSDNSLVVDVALPAGYHLNPSAPQKLKATIEKGASSLNFGASNSDVHNTTSDVAASRTLKVETLPVRVSLRSISMGAAEMRVQLTIYFCREDNTGTCRIKTLVWRVPVEIVKDEKAAHELRVHSKVEL